MGYAQCSERIHCSRARLDQYRPEEHGGGCGDDCVVDDGGEAGGVLVAEGEHGLIVVGVSDIGVFGRVSVIFHVPVMISFCYYR